MNMSRRQGVRSAYLLCLLSLSVFLLSPVEAAAKPQRVPRTSTEEWQAIVNRNQRVVAQSDPVLRNFQITESYFEIGILFQSLMGTTVESGNPQGNWPTIATWASNSVGMSIRGETLPDYVWIKLKDKLPSWLIHLLQFFPSVVDFIFSSILKTTSGYLAEGNKIVFDQVGGTMARFGLYFANLTAPNDTLWYEFQDTFNANDPIELLLINATQAYYNAMWTTGKKQAENMLLANMFVGLAEQTRLQPYIYGSMLNNKTIQFHFPGIGTISINEAALVTQMLISLLFSNEILYAGADVTPRPWDGADWPADLTTLDYPATRALYLQLVGQTVNFNNTAAHNWVQLSQRMRFVVPMFRSRQDDVQLVTCPPFSSDQVAMIWSGVKPKSKTLCMANCCKNARSSHKTNQ